MHDLEKRISHWRRTLSDLPSSRPDAIIELEEHLRDEITRLIETGVDPEKAFELSVSKIGDPSSVACEFRKLDACKSWLPVKIAWGGISLLLLFALFFCYSIAAKKGLLLAAHVGSVILGYSSMFALGGLGICYVVAWRLGWLQSGQRDSLRPTAFRLATLSVICTVVGVVLGMFWARENLGRMWAWDAKEVGGLIIMIFGGFISLSRWFRPSTRTIAILALLGNVATAWGWFGANAAGFSPGLFLLTFSVGHFALIMWATVGFAEKNRGAAVRG